MHDMKLREPGRADALPGGIHRASTAPHRVDVELLQRDLKETAERLDDRISTLAKATLTLGQTTFAEIDRLRQDVGLLPPRPPRWKRAFRRFKAWRSRPRPRYLRDDAPEGY